MDTQVEVATATRCGEIRRGGGLKLGSVSGWSCAKLLLAALCHVPGGTVARAGDGRFCLPDADGDGYSLFGNPEVMLNPFSNDSPGDDHIPTAGAIGRINAADAPGAVALYAWWEPELNPDGVVPVLLNHGDGMFTAVAVFDAGEDPSDDNALKSPMPSW